MVCRGVPKSTTVPIPTRPVTSNPRVFPCLWQSLGAWNSRHYSLDLPTSKNQQVFQPNMATSFVPFLAIRHRYEQMCLDWHLRHIKFCRPGGIWILPWEINRLLLCLWWWGIFKDGIGIHSCLFIQDKRIIHIQILFSGYNLNTDYSFVLGK